MTPLFAATFTNLLWYLVPLIISVSLSYGATRHEEMAPIINHAFRFGIWFAAFMAVLYGVVILLAWSL